MGGRSTRTRLAVLAVAATVAATVLGPTGAAPARAQTSGSLMLTKLRIAAPYAGRLPDCLGPMSFCLTTPVTTSGTLSVDLTCLLVWCVGTTRVQTVDPRDPTKTVTLGGFGLGVVQVCPDSVLGTEVSLSMNAVVSTPTPPGFKVSPVRFAVWAGPGAKAGRLTMDGTEPPIGGPTSSGWTVYGQVDPAAIVAEAVRIPFWFPLLCI